MQEPLAGRAESSLMESERIYESLVQDLPAHVCRFLPGGILIYANEQYCAFFSKAREELVGKSFFDFLSSQDRDAVETAIGALCPEHSVITYEHRVQAPDGSIKWQQWSHRAFFDASGAPLEYQSVGFDITDRKLSEDALRKSEERIRLIVENVPHAIFRWSVENGLEYASPNVKTITGYTAQELLSDPMLGLKIVAASQPGLMDDYNQVLSTGATLGAKEILFVRKDGTEVCLEANAQIVRDEQDLIVAFEGVLSDITERKRAEEQLLTSQVHLSNALRIAGLGHWEYDVARDEFTFTDEFYSLFRTSAEQMGGYTMSSARYAETFVHAGDRDKVAEEIRELLESPEPNYSRQLEHRIIYADGEIGHIAVRFRVIKDSEGRTVKTFGANQDITERKQAEELLRKSEARFSSLFEESPVGVSLDREDMILYANKAFAEIHGYDSPKELIGTSILNLVEPALREEYAVKIKRTSRADDRFPRGEEIEILKKNGDRVPALLSVSYMELHDGPANVVFITDMAKYKQIQQERESLREQLVQSQKMQAVGQLAGGVAHDFNNMLGVIIGNAELAMMKLDPQSPIRQKLQEIHNAADRSANLTRQLLAFARKQTIIPKVLDLNETVSGMLNMLERLIGEDIDLAWLPETNLWNVKIDPTQVDQILTNLVVNSRDAIAGQGKITIETGHAVFDESYCADHPEFIPGEYVLLAVSDNGCGIVKDNIEHIFEPFFTTKPIGVGTGLGLATVFGIVKQNNGFINVYSEPGLGATFKIYLQRFRDEAARPALQSEPKVLFAGNETVLIVEDEPGILELGQDILESLGYRVLTADTPRKAIRLAREFGGPIHLLLTDVVMPEMSGREMAEQIVASRPAIKRLFMSGYTANVIAHHGVLDEDVRFIQKPFSIEALSRKVREILDE